MSETEYVEYFEELARQHVAIRHTASAPRFYVAQDNNKTVIDKQMRNAKFPLVLLDQYYDDIDRTNDNYRLNVMGGLSVVVKCKAEEPADVRRARTEARSIALQFINRMFFDCRDSTGLLFSKRITPSTQFEGEPTPIFGGTAAGWGYPFEWKLPTTVAVDRSVWGDLAL